MRKLKFYQKMAGAVIMIFMISCVSSCGTSSRSLASQRRGYMLLEKSEYSVNKGRKVPTKNYKDIKSKKRKSNKKHY